MIMNVLLDYDALRVTRLLLLRCQRCSITQMSCEMPARLQTKKVINLASICRMLPVNVTPERVNSDCY